VQIHGNVVIGEGVHLSGPLDINGNDCQVVIGEGCDIGAFTAINCADSHMRCLGLSSRIERKPITLEHHIFVGTLCLIKGGVFIGHHSVVAGGSVVDMGIYPPYSLIYGSYPTQVKPKYYGAQCYPPRA
jgi:acetyltransferase-like isoleucine patch superfamily enzyme